jgi:hypothetical protein
MLAAVRSYEIEVDSRVRREETADRGWINSPLTSPAGRLAGAFVGELRRCTMCGMADPPVAAEAAI